MKPNRVINWLELRLNWLSKLSLSTEQFWWICLWGGALLAQGPHHLIMLSLVAMLGWWLWGRSLAESAFLTSLTFLPIRTLLVGQWLLVTPPIPELGLGGYAFTSGLDLLAIFLVLAILLWLVERPRTTIHWTRSAVVLLAFFGVATISSVSAHRLELAGAGWWTLAQAVALFFLSSIFFQTKQNQTLFKRYLIGLGIFLGVVGVGQLLVHHSLGLFIETRTAAIGEFFTTDGESLYRVPGITPHPTYFAALLSLLLPSLWLLSVDGDSSSKNSRWLVIGSLVLVLVSLIGTFSRSAWLAGVVWLLILIWQSKTRKLKMVATAGLVTFTLFFLTRLHSLSTITSSSSALGRWQLLRHATQMMTAKPLVGVGLNHFTQVMVQQGIKPGFERFVYPVHNTFMLFFAELGILGGGLWVLFVLLLLKDSWQAALLTPGGLGVWLGLCTFVINAQFHALFNQDPSFNLFMVLSGYLVAAHANTSPRHPRHRHLSTTRSTHRVSG